MVGGTGQGMLRLRCRPLRCRQLRRMFSGRRSMLSFSLVDRAARGAILTSPGELFPLGLSRFKLVRLALIS